MNRRRVLYRVCVALSLIFSLAPAVARAADSAVILIYHRFGEEEYPSTNIATEQFEEHLRELKTGGYAVLPLPQVVETLKKGGDLPDKTVVITIDDAYTSLYRRAWPLLRRYKMPFTIFVATDTIDEGGGDFMTWKQLRELSREDGVTIGSQTASHPHMITNGSQNNVAELAKSNERFEKNLGRRPDYLAYPYGEYSPEVQKTAREAGFKAALGQHSGVTHADSDFFALPRFAFNEEYSNIDRFRTAVKSLPLPASEITPSSPVLNKDKNNPPAFGFTLTEDMPTLNQLACYAGDQGKADIITLENKRVEVRLKQPLKTGRGRINCTAPRGDGRWYWLGAPFFVLP